MLPILGLQPEQLATIPLDTGYVSASAKPPSTAARTLRLAGVPSSRKNRMRTTVAVITNSIHRAAQLACLCPYRTISAGTGLACRPIPTTPSVGRRRSDCSARRSRARDGRLPVRPRVTLATCPTDGTATPGAMRRRTCLSLAHAASSGPNMSRSVDDGGPHMLQPRPCPRGEASTAAPADCCLGRRGGAALRDRRRAAPSRPGPAGPQPAAAGRRHRRRGGSPARGRCQLDDPRHRPWNHAPRCSPAVRRDAVGGLRQHLLSGPPPLVQVCERLIVVIRGAPGGCQRVVAM